MKKRTAELILKDPEKFAHHDRVFLNNPVVMQGMGLAPLVVASPFAWFDRAEYETSAGGVRKVRVERP